MLHGDSGRALNSGYAGLTAREGDRAGVVEGEPGRYERAQ